MSRDTVHMVFREAAALGLMERIERAFASDDAPTLDDITQAFWYACHGGQRLVAEYLLDRGADINWTSTWDNLTPLAARPQRSHRRIHGEACKPT